MSEADRTTTHTESSADDQDQASRQEPAAPAAAPQRFSTPGPVRAFCRRQRQRLRRLSVRLRPLRTPARIAGLVVLAFFGGALGLTLGGASNQSVGPVDTTMRFSLSVSGGTVVNLPPLGTLELDSHGPPLRLDVTVDEIDSGQAEAIFEDPRVLAGLEQRALDDLRSGLVTTAIQSGIAAIIGATLVVLVVTRRWRPVLLASAVGIASTAGAFGIGWATRDEQSVLEPRYTGLLAGAPSLVGNVYEIVEDFDAYRDILAGLVTNVTQLYHASSSLPTFRPDAEMITVLHISDLELNPYAWDIVESVTEQYSADVIVDTGDTTDHGSAAENPYLDSINNLDVPYVWVRGNHDSMITQEYIESLDNTIVLDGQVEEVEGIRFLGAGDPRFTPDRSSRNTREEARAVITQAQAMVNLAEDEEEPIDIIAYHDPDGAPVIDGHAKLFLAGHKHNRTRTVLPEGTRMMVEGSTGGDGLRALQKGEPAPVELSLLYIDAETKELQAWDEITMGGLGLTSANIERFNVAVSGEDEEVTTPGPYPTPTEPIPTSPLPGPTVTDPPETPPVDPPEAQGQDGDEVEPDVDDEAEPDGPGP